MNIHQKISPTGEGALNWFPDSLGETVRHIVDRIAEHGPTPIISVVIAVFGLAALAAGANSFAVVAICFVAMVGHIYAQERRASWKRQELRNEYDDLQQIEGQKVNKRVYRRLEFRRRSEEPGLFDEVVENDPDAD